MVQIDWSLEKRGRGSKAQGTACKKDAYRMGDKVLYKQAKYTLEKEIRIAKRNYSDKLRIQFSSSDSASVWKGMKDVTSYKTPLPSTVENQQQAHNLNEFYWRFEKHTRPTLNTSQHNPPPATPAIQISEDEVCQVFRKHKRKKAPGPDGVTPACLQSCADQLAPIFTKIFNRSLELCKVPSYVKCCTIIPITNKPQITALNVYWSVALSLSQVYRSKSFEKLVLAHLKDITGPSLDPLQFAYRTNRSVDDEVNMGLHYVLQHLDRPGAYVRVLFVDFSSTFNPCALFKFTTLSLCSGWKHPLN